MRKFTSIAIPELESAPSLLDEIAPKWVAMSKAITVYEMLVPSMLLWSQYDSLKTPFGRDLNL